MTDNKKQEDQTANFMPEFYHTPGIVQHDKELQPLDKVVYSIIYWLERLKDGRCFASNKTIGSIANSSASGVANSLVRLRKQGYVYCEYDDNDQRKSIKTLVFNTVNPYSNEEGGVTQMSNRKSNTNINTYGPKILEQMNDLHKGYVIYFKINPDKYAYATPEERETLINDAIKRYKLTDERKAKINTRLQDAGFDMCKRAILNANKSEWNHGANPSGWKMDLYKYLFRSYEQVEDWGSRND